MRLASALAITLLCCAGTAGAAQDGAPTVVGAVGAAIASPVGRAPGRAQRTLVPGAPIYFHDHISTARGGSAQLAFLDRSTLSVGENSDLVIDEFVYKPGGAATMTASLTKGVIRFVGGEISHDGGTTIKTPTVTIGIRGGIGLIGSVADAATLRDVPGVPSGFHGGTVVVNGYGTLTLRNAQSEVVISRPGFAVFVDQAGGPIGAPVRVSPGAATAMMRQMTTHAAQRGSTASAGARAPNATASSAAPRFASLPLPAVAAVSAPTVKALEFTSTFSAGNSLARTRSQAQQAVQLQQAITQVTAFRAAASPSNAIPGTPGGAVPAAGAQAAPGAAPGAAPAANATGSGSGTSAASAPAQTYSYYGWFWWNGHWWYFPY